MMWPRAAGRQIRPGNTSTGSVGRLPDCPFAWNAASPQPVQPDRDGLPHSDPVRIASLRQSSNAFGNMKGGIYALALFDSKRAGPEVLFIGHKRPSSQHRKDVA